MPTLEERLAAARGSTAPSQQGEDITTEAAKYIQNLNIGLANTLGAPVEMVSNLMKATGVISPETTPVLGNEQIRDFFTNIGATPEVGKEQKGFVPRALRIAGETAVPFGFTQRAGAKIALEAPAAMSGLQKALLAAYQSPWKAAGAEATAVLGAAAGGEGAATIYPDSHVAEVFGELLGGVTPAAATSLAGALPGPKVVKDIFMEEGAKVRAGRRVGELAGDVDKARASALQASELDLDPITASGDAGLLALEKAALEADPKLAERVANLTSAAMNKARNRVIGGGDASATVEYLKGLRRVAAARAQKDIIELGTDVSPVAAARAVRTHVESSLRQARAIESTKWSKLPTKGQVATDKIVDTFENVLSERSIAADPEDIPTFLYDFIGKPEKGVFKVGKAVKKPELGVMKDLRSRIQNEIAVERAKDAPNRNKVRVLGQIQESIFDSIADFSPEYREAVDYSRQLNQNFTQGKIGDMLGYERTGELSTSAEGTLDFLVSGNKDDVRMGLRQLANASPEAVPMVRENVKATFNVQAIDPDSGALNVRNARRFLKNNEHILDEFPDLKEQISRSITTQRAVDELVGAPVGDKLSTYIKDKSVAALYLEGTPDTAMHRLVTAKNSQGQGAMMKQMLELTNQDPTGRATKGLKSAFGSYLIKHSEAADTTVLSGKKFLKMLTELSEPAKQLYDKEEISRLFRIGTELRKIEQREAIRAAKGGVISDAPSKIIHLIGGTFAARAGAKAGAGTSGASLRTASLATKEFNALMGRLTNDGAEQIIMKAVEDKAVLNTLLKEATPTNIEQANKVFRSFLTGQAITAGDNETGQEPLSLEQRLEKLRRAHSGQ